MTALIRVFVGQWRGGAQGLLGSWRPPGTLGAVTPLHYSYQYCYYSYSYYDYYYYSHLVCGSNQFVAHTQGGRVEGGTLTVEG